MNARARCGAVPASRRFPGSVGTRPAARHVRSGLTGILFACAMLLAFASAVPAASAQAVRNVQPLEFQDRAEEQRFHRLTSELRCVMCQNQSLADSDAPIAHDLRREVFNLMREGRSDAEIKVFLVERYGEFVLYRPQFGGGTLMLWLGPALVFLAGALVVFVVVRKRAAANRAALPPVDDGEEWP